MLKVLCGSCADFYGKAERILDSNGDSCTRVKQREAVEWKKVDPQKYKVRHFLLKV